MPVDFLGREIEVRLSEDEAAAPLAFRLGSREYKIAEQLTTWEDRGFGNLQRGRDWRQQQQRRYYRVRTEEGECTSCTPTGLRHGAAGRGARTAPAGTCTVA